MTKYRTLKDRVSEEFMENARRKADFIQEHEKLARRGRSYVMKKVRVPEKKAA